MTLYSLSTIIYPEICGYLGRVVEVHKSSQDGRVRSVKVKTKSSVLERPIDKLVLLEGADFAEGQVSKVPQGEKDR